MTEDYISKMKIDYVSKLNGLDRCLHDERKLPIHRCILMESQNSWDKEKHYFPNMKSKKAT